MENQLIELTGLGFVVCPNGQGKWEVVRFFDGKIVFATADTYEEAVGQAHEKLRQPKLQEYTATVRYHRGLGVEYKTLPAIQALTLDEARRAASEQAEQLLGASGVEIREVRVRPKG